MLLTKCITAQGFVIHTYIHTCIYIHTYTHIHTHTHIHIHIHIYIYIYIYIYTVVPLLRDPSNKRPPPIRDQKAPVRMHVPYNLTSHTRPPTSGQMPTTRFSDRYPFAHAQAPPHHLKHAVFDKMTGRKRKVLNLEQRLEVLKKIDSGMSCRKVASEFGVGKTQIQAIIF